MELVEIKTKKEKRQYIKFIYEVYKNDKEYCDMNILFVKNFLYQKDRYSKRNTIIPIFIKNKEKIVLECMFIFNNKSSEIKLSFLEFLPNSKKYLEKLIKYSKELMKKYNKKKVVVGVNGHVSCGLGILTDKYNTNFEFNSNYNPGYYTKELDKVFPKMTRAFSYFYDAKHALELIDQEKMKKVDEEYTFRYLDMKHFKRDMLIFGQLSKALFSTDYYQEKTNHESFELMKQMQILLRKEDLIFAMKDGKEVGYILAHPDYAELFSKPRVNYVTFFLKYLFKKPKVIIYNVICVIPEHHGTGLALDLINHSIKDRIDKYPTGVSSFILESNKPSSKLCGSLADGINKEFHLYEVDCED